MRRSRQIAALSLAVGTVLSFMPLFAAAQAVAPSASPIQSSASGGVTSVGGGLMINFESAAIETVLNELSQVAGYVVVEQVKPEGRITIISRQPMSREDTVVLLNSILNNAGYAAVLRGERILKILPSKEAADDIIPVRKGLNPKDIPMTDEIVVQIIPLQNIDAATTIRDLSNYVSAQGYLTANAASNTIIITDTSAHINKLARILVELDASVSDTAIIKVYDLRYAASSQVATLITNTFRQQQQTGVGGGMGGGGGAQQRGGTTGVQQRGTTVGGRGGATNLGFAPGLGYYNLELAGRLEGGGGGGGGFGGGGGGVTGGRGQSVGTGGAPGGTFGGGGGRGVGGTGAGGLAQRRQIQVTATSNDSTNQVVVSASAEQLRQIDELIKAIDVPPIVEEEVIVVRVKNGDVSNIANLLNNLFSGSSYGGTTNRGGTTQRGTTIGGATNRGGTTGRSGTTGARGSTDLGFDPGLGYNSLSEAGGLAGAAGGGTTAGRAGGTGTTGGRGGQTGRSGTTTGTLGQTNRGTTGTSAYGNSNSLISVIPDTYSNALIIRTDPNYRPQILEILNQLDRAVPQVLIKVLIAEVQHTNGQDLGAELSALNIRTSGLGGKVNTAFGLNSGSTANTGMNLALLETDFAATIRALETEGKLDILSRPYVLASDNQEAYILVGGSYPYISNSTLNTTSNSVINTVQYTDIGISIDVIPHINPDGLVTLDIAPSITAIDNSSSGVVISQGITAPVFTSRQASTRVAIRNGQTVVIGGLMADTQNDTVSKVPLLGDIPILGEMFKYHHGTKVKSELLIFLTPHVASDPDKLPGMSQDEVAHVRLVPGAVYPNAFEEHMQGLEAGIAAPDAQGAGPIIIRTPQAATRPSRGTTVGPRP